MTSPNPATVRSKSTKPIWRLGCLTISVVLLIMMVWLILPVTMQMAINIATIRIRIDGYAMQSTLANGDYIIADRRAYQQNPPQRGDIVIFQTPASLETTSLLIKRVIGLPGDVVSIDNGQVFIDSVPLDEPYITSPATYSGEWKVPEGHYFVLGDNRNDSRDSHQWGFLPSGYIVAKAVWVYWPVTHFGRIKK